MRSWQVGRNVTRFPSTLSSWRHFRKRWRITNRTTRQASDCSPIAHRGGAVIAMATFADLDIRFHLSQGPDHRGVRLRYPVASSAKIHPRWRGSCPSTASLAYVPESLQRLGDTAAGRLDQPLVGLATGEPPTPADLYRCHRRGTRAGEQVADRLTGAAQRLDQSDGFLHGLLPGVERLIPFRFLQHVSDGRIEVEASLAEYDDWYPSIYNLVSLPEATHLSHGNDGPLYALNPFDRCSMESSFARLI